MLAEKRTFIINALIAEMRFFGIPIKSLSNAPVKLSLSMGVRIMFGSATTRETIPKSKSDCLRNPIKQFVLQIAVSNNSLYRMETAKYNK